jgi:asparagine synthase (glutamine-hydrolysing)
MCGISGWLLNQPKKFRYEDLISMSQAMSHRGPDDSGIYYDESGNLALAHNRLSIIDLSSKGHQPMISGTAGDILVYNGEIYNYRELRSELIDLGYRFRSRTDTEVLLNAFAQWGSQCLRRLRGMFAFAMWVKACRTLYLARDPMGIKPLYYWIMPDSQGLVFASEIKAFLKLPNFCRKVDQTALNQFLEFGYSFSEKSIFQGVKKLAAGHLLAIRPGVIGQPQRFFHPKVMIQTSAINPARMEEKLYNTLSTVVKQHLMADVPVGLLLSGGLDSSLIAALAARETRIKTFSMGFGQSSVDERPFARQVSEYIGSEHYEFEIMPDELTHNLESNMAYYDDIFADWGMISTKLLYEKCREQGIKVVIVGEGSDELFGGYDTFRFPFSGYVARPLDWHLFLLYRRYAGRRYGGQFQAFRRQMRRYLKRTKNDWFCAIRLFESCNQLPNNYVMKVDKASMAVSIEARVPYLDSRVAEIAYQIPKDFLLAPDSEKCLLRSMARRYKLLDESILTRRKFGAPIAVTWMDDVNSFRSFAREVILSNTSWVDDLGLRCAMVDYFDKGRSGYGFPRAISIFRNLAWRLLILNLWSRFYLWTV